MTQKTKHPINEGEETKGVERVKLQLGMLRKKFEAEEQFRVEIADELMFPFYAMDVIELAVGDIVGYKPGVIGLIGKITKIVQDCYQIKRIPKQTQPYMSYSSGFIHVRDVVCIFFPENIFGKKYRLVMTYPGMKDKRVAAEVKQSTDREELEDLKAQLERKCGEEDFYAYYIQDM